MILKYYIDNIIYITNIIIFLYIKYIKHFIYVINFLMLIIFAYTKNCFEIILIFLQKDIAIFDLIDI